MNPTEAMETVIREIATCKSEAIGRGVARAVGASEAFARIGAMSEFEDLEWRQKARKAGIEQEHRMEPGVFVWDHKTVQQLKSPGCSREWTLKELVALDVPYAPLMECPQCEDIMTVRRVDTQKV